MAHSVYAQEVGTWLDSLSDWQYWATFTYRYSPSLPAIRRSMGWFASEISPNLMFWGSESGACTGRNHVHALLSLDEGANPSPKQAREIWEVAFRRFGRSHVDIFNPRLGAAHYVGKYVSKTMSDWDLIDRYHGFHH